jgi:hypothetical protein
MSKENKEEIIEYIKQNLFPVPSKSVWNSLKNTPCSVSTVRKLFGSWNNAIIAAGLTPLRKKREPAYCPVCNKPAKRKYCSVRCANLDKPRRKKQGKCKSCDLAISASRTYCDGCYKDRKNNLDLDGRSKKEIESHTKSSSAKYSVIATHARKKYLNILTKCMCCNYTRHVEVCHIKSVRSFPDSALLKDINSPENIVILCPNCHWELDHKMLMIDKHEVIGKEISCSFKSIA